MTRDPDDIFGPDNKVPKGPVIDVTPGKKPRVVDEESGIKSPETLLKEAMDRQRLDRTDKTKNGCFAKAMILLIMSFLLLFFSIFLLVKVL